MNTLKKTITGISGAGGGGGGGASRAAVEDSDTLQSKAFVSLLDLLGEGEIGGLVNGAKSIYFNGTPLENADGTRNFAGVTIDSRNGTQAQLPIPGYGEIESPAAIGVKITKDISYTYAVSNSNANSVRVIVSIPALVRIDGDTGDTHGSSVSYTISVSTNGGSFAVLSSQTITGKTRSKYQRSTLISLPKPGTSYLIRVTRSDADSTTSNLVNETWLDSVSEIISSQLSYPNSALVSTRIDSAQFNQIPTRSYLVQGLYIKVPANYDPIARTYSGVWNGSFKLAVSDNPAWILYDLLSNTRYGLGNFISNAQVDKTALYTIGKYCDGTVSDGFGGTEARFRISTAIQTQAEAYKVITDISSVFKGMTYWAGSQVGFVQDSPVDPTMIYSPANVINGDFQYTGTARKDRHSVALITWNDPNDAFKQHVEYVEDAALIAQFGVRKVEVVAFGCTSRGQANRVGRWMLFTEKYESNFVTFSVGIDSAFVVPGDVVRIQDPARAGKRLAGRIASATPNSVVLDSPVTLTSPDATISMRLTDGTFVDRAVLQQVGTFATLSWSDSAAVPDAGAMFIISETTLTPMMVRVLGISEVVGKSAEFQISAVEHVAAKFGYIEQGLVLPPSTITPLFNVPVAPTSLSITDHIYRTGLSLSTMLDISWQDAQVGVSWWEVSVREALGVWTTTQVSSPSFSVPNVRDGVAYSVSVASFNALGKKGNASIAASHLVIGKAAPPSNVASVTSSYSGGSLVLNWSSVSDLDLDHYEVREGSAWASATTVVSTGDTFFALPPAYSGSHTYQVCAWDTTGHVSILPAALTVTVAVPAAPANLTTTSDNTFFTSSWSAVVSPQTTVAYRISLDGNIIDTTNALTYSLSAAWVGAKTISVQAIDSAGNVGAAATVTTTVVAPIAPVFSAVTFVGTSAKLVWQSCKSTMPIVSYEIRMGASWATGASVGIVTAQTISLVGNWIGNQTYWAAALDSANNTGAVGSVVVTISYPKTPTITSATSDGNVVLNWSDAASSLPISSYEVLIGATLATSTSVGRIAGNTFSTKINWSGAKNIYVRASDVSGNTGAAGSTSLTISSPSTPIVASVISGTQTLLSWTSTAGTLLIDSYEIRYGSGAWTAATKVSIIKSNSISIPITWTGDRQFQVVSTDISGNSSPVTVSTVTINAPSASVVTASFLSDQFNLSWTQPVSTLSVVDYEVRYGLTWATATSVSTIKGTGYAISAQWGGMRRWWVTARDANGNVGTPASCDVTVSGALASAVTQQVVDNNVLLYWSQVAGTLPTTTYEIRRGSTWALGSGTIVIGVKSGGFTTVFETAAGSYVYWVCAIDSAGNYGTPASVGATVSQPPDYVLKANVFSTFGGIKTNMAYDGIGAWVLPVNTAESFSGHFTGHSWNTPQDQVAAGYPIYVQPALIGVGSYVETMDYGQVLSSSKISITLAGAVVSGSPTLSTDIAISLDGVTWTTYTGVSQVFGSNFRYVKLSLFVTAATSLDLYALTGFNFRLDSKLKADAGMGSAGASDAVTGSNAVMNGTNINQANPTVNGVRVSDGAGTLVLFTQQFLDISSIDVSISAGTSARYAVYDFLDAPSPTGFKVLLYDGSGNRTAGSFSWSSKGY